MHPRPPDKILTLLLWSCASVSAAYAWACAGFYPQYCLTYGPPRPDGQPQATDVPFPLLDGAAPSLLLAPFVTVPPCVVPLVAVRIGKAPSGCLARRWYYGRK
jgi:hypothetical protein